LRIRNEGSQQQPAMFTGNNDESIIASRPRMCGGNNRVQAWANAAAAWVTH